MDERFKYISLSIQNYLCFGEEPQKIETFKPFNIVIGRNNSGKSTLLDVIERICMCRSIEEMEESKKHINSKREPSCVITSKDQSFVGFLNRNNPNREFGIAAMKGVDWSLSTEQKRMLKISNDENNDASKHVLQSYFIGLYTSRIGADRDLYPESNKANLRADLHRPFPKFTNQLAKPFLKNGQNLTQSLVQLNLRERQAKIHGAIITDLNTVFGSKPLFTRIECKLKNPEEETFEVVLEQSNYVQASVDEMGSGVKTVLSVLIHLHLLPNLLRVEANPQVYIFEELENNLHPLLLRRMLDLLERRCREKNAMLFLSTHSPIVIDFFAATEDTQIIHVTHDGESSKLRVVQTYIDNHAILDDLGAKASDLLLANSVIWVEGPSDRIYLKRWIELWDSELKEGSHYQIVFSGGTLLSYLSADKPNEALEKELIPVLKVNRHNAFFCDSDKKEASVKLKDRVSKIKEESERIELSHIWITSGKETENYISDVVVREGLNLDGFIGTKDKFKPVFDHEDLKKYEKRKADLARKLIPKMTRENMQGALDLDEQMKELCNQIRKWNGMKLIH